jgi:hypothetical protein
MVSDPPPQCRQRVTKVGGGQVDTDRSGTGRHRLKGVRFTPYREVRQIDGTGPHRRPALDFAIARAHVAAPDRQTRSSNLTVPRRKKQTPRHHGRYTDTNSKEWNPNPMQSSDLAVGRVVAAWVPAASESDSAVAQEKSAASTGRGHASRPSGSNVPQAICPGQITLYATGTLVRDRDAGDNHVR